MGKRNRYSFTKREKEKKRKQKADEKMARRHAKRRGESDDASPDSPEVSEDQPES